MDAWVETMRLMPDAESRAEMAMALLDYAYDGTPYKGRNTMVKMMMCNLAKEIDHRRRIAERNAKNGKKGGNPTLQGRVAAKSVNPAVNPAVAEEPLLLTMPEPEKPKKSESFERCWVAYGRKGSKKAAMTQWYKLTDADRERAEKHIPHYIKSTERQFLKDFERYLMHRVFESPVYERGAGVMIYDPSRIDDGRYTPRNNSIWFDEATKTYWSSDPFYDGIIYDGYDDTDRPDGAKITLNNARGTIHWNSQTKKWDKIR